MGEQKIEQRLEEIEKAVIALESKDISLEEAFGFYQEGIQQIKECKKMLEQLEGQIRMLTQDGELIEFGGEEQQNEE